MIFWKIAKKLCSTPIFSMRNLFIFPGNTFILARGGKKWKHKKIRERQREMGHSPITQYWSADIKYPKKNISFFFTNSAVRMLIFPQLLEQVPDNFISCGNKIKSFQKKQVGATDCVSLQFPLNKKIMMWHQKFQSADKIGPQLFAFQQFFFFCRTIFTWGRAKNKPVRKNEWKSSFREKSLTNIRVNDQWMKHRTTHEAAALTDGQFPYLRFKCIFPFTLVTKKKTRGTSSFTSATFPFIHPLKPSHSQLVEKKCPEFDAPNTASMRKQNYSNSRKIS